jgi:hypothetical protein
VKDIDPETAYAGQGVSQVYFSPFLQYLPPLAHYRPYQAGCHSGIQGLPLALDLEFAVDPENRRQADREMDIGGPGGSRRPQDDFDINHLNPPE